MQRMILDLETSIKNKGADGKPYIGNNRASPHWPDNQVVLSMWQYTTQRSVSCRWYDVPPPPEGGVEVIGHNIKFDMLYLLTRYPEWREKWDKGEVTIYCTQLAEYILTAQQLLYPSLDKCAVKYGGTLKDDRIKEFWEEGVDTEDIPREMLQEYGIADIVNTHLVWAGQRRDIKKYEMVSLIETQMMGLAGTIEMELNGMKFDAETALLIADTLAEQQKVREMTLNTYLTPTPFDFNWASTLHVGAFLFGGDVSYDDVETVYGDDGIAVEYKSGAKKGQVKTRKCKSSWRFTKLHTPKIEWENSRGWKVDDNVLKELEAEGSVTVQQIANTLRKYRETEKDVNTYYIGYSELVFPDGMLHGNINHCSTSTGRLSSTNPNLQNVSKG